MFLSWSVMQEGQPIQSPPSDVLKATAESNGLTTKQPNHIRHCRHPSPSIGAGFPASLHYDKYDNDEESLRATLYSGSPRSPPAGTDDTAGCTTWRTTHLHNFEDSHICTDANICTSSNAIFKSALGTQVHCQMYNKVTES